mmetsp:Transcript_132994/g.331823  ORF Transcript_132994/g.331823 Transcript_132994/m.331823 type:complete len:533 (-) Transcript_132994:34-1632(-)
MQVSGIHPPGQTPEALDVAILVPGDNIAKIIGKAGSGLKQIREASGCKINVQAAGADRTATRRIDLIGQPVNIGHASGCMLATAFQGQPSVEVIVLIPDKCIGSVIGRGGENLKRVRETAGIHIQVERDPVLNPMTGEQERMLTVTGEPTMCGNGLGIALGNSGNACLPGLPASGGLPAGTPACAQQPPEVHSMGDDPDAVQIHLVIPGRLTGAIVGKQGSTIQQLAAQAGCKLAVSTRTSSADRRVICVGAPTCVVAAQQLVHNAALQACDTAGLDKELLNTVTAIFWIPKESSGAIIGKAGSTLGHIREQSMVKVQFGKEEARQMRPCTIMGSLQNVIHAEGLIINILIEDRIKQGPAKRPPVIQDTSDDSKRVRMGEFVDEQTKLLVPAKRAGAVIGKQGSGLGRIREECGVKVDMLQQSQAPYWPEDRILTLQGPLANRAAAVGAVLQMAFQGIENECVLKMLVSKADAGAIIGKSGSMLKQLRESTGISTQVEKEEVAGERLVHSQGAFLPVTAVARMIMDVLARSH